MTEQDAALLAALPGYAFAFIMVLARVGSAMMLLPGFGEAEVPMPVRAALAVALTLVMMPVVAPLLPPEPADMMRALLGVAAEVIAGLWLGWLARLLVLALPMAAQLAAGMIGLSNVLQPDPVLGPQTSALSRLFSLAAPVAIMATGLHALPLEALEGSYHVIPPGLALPGGDAAQAVVQAVGSSFALALRLAAPFVLASIVWNVALGLLAKLVPQLQVYFAGMPAQIMGGILLVGLLSSAVLSAWLGELRTGFSALPGL
jgi:flagellar biosynthetic protein FliR